MPPVTESNRPPLTAGSPKDGPLIGVTLTRGQEAAAARAAYLEAIAAAGGVPIPVPYGLDRASLRRLLLQLDGILLSGGGDIAPGRYRAASSPLLRGVDAERDSVELDLARWAVEGGKPILGICRGLQVMNVAFGGSLIQDIASEVRGAFLHDRTDAAGDLIVHSVDMEPGLLYETQGRITSIEANSSHHQAVRGLAEGLRVSGRSPDGIVEALEIPGLPFAAAVQWHPERLLRRPEARGLFNGLTHAAGGR